MCEWGLWWSIRACLLQQAVSSSAARSRGPTIAASLFLQGMVIIKQYQRHCDSVRMIPWLVSSTMHFGNSPFYLTIIYLYFLTPAFINWLIAWFIFTIFRRDLEHAIIFYNWHTRPGESGLLEQVSVRVSVSIRASVSRACGLLGQVSLRTGHFLAQVVS